MDSTITPDRTSERAPEEIVADFEARARRFETPCGEGRMVWRAWGEGLHHIIDAVTGRPVGGVIGTWAVAATALEADGLATALFVTEPAELEAAFDFTWVRMFSDGRLEASARWEGELFR